MNKSRSEKMKRHWATLSKEKRAKRNRAGGIALWKKIKAGNLTTQA